MNQPMLARRTVVIAAAGVLALEPTLAGAASSARDEATEPADPLPVPLPRHAPGADIKHNRHGSADVIVYARTVQDVVAISVTVTNMGTTAETYSLSSVDQVRNKESKKRNVQVHPGRQVTTEFYGHPKSTFMVRTCQSDGTCFDAGPVSGPLGVRPTAPATPTSQPTPGAPA